MQKNVYKIPFSPPYIDDDVINEVVDSLKKGWITTGPKVDALEEEISNYHLNNIMNGLSPSTYESMIRAIKMLKPGDEVIIPAPFWVSYHLERN